MSAAHGTTAQHALDGLRTAIIGGELRPGQHLLQEEIARRLGVSVVPLREALAVLEQEGQVSYRPRRGYHVSELKVEDLAEIYELRELLESRAALRSLPLIDDAALERIDQAQRDCVNSAGAGDVAAELEANRRFHFAILDSPGQVHTMRVIRLLWDSTEAYRALFYGSPQGRGESIGAHERIVEGIRNQDSKRLIAELSAHRDNTLRSLARVLGPR